MIYRLPLALSLASVAALALPRPGSAQDGQLSVPPRQTGGPTTALDDSGAQYLSSAYGISLEEGRKRIKIMEEARRLRQDLATNESATFADLSIKHRPVFQVVVAFTDEDERKIARRNLSPELRRYIKLRRAKHAKVGRIRDIRSVLKAIEGLSIDANAWLDPDTDNIVIQSPAAARIREAVAAGRLKLPADTEIQEGGITRPTAATVPSGANPPTSSDYIGPGFYYYNRYKDGTSVRQCTFGFKAEYQGRIGLLTAGHCESRDTAHADTDVVGTGYWHWSGRWVELYAPTLEFNVTFVRGGTGDKYDFQFHPTPVWSVQTDIYVGGSPANYVRPIGIVNSASVGRGDAFCKFGIATGYVCGGIENANHYWAGDQSYGYWRFSRTDYGGTTSTSTTAGGDSGGPVFTVPDDGTVYAAALQVGQVPITKNGVTYIDSVQMPIDYIDDAYPVRLILAP